MAEEIETKILEVNPRVIRGLLKGAGGKRVMRMNKQTSLFFETRDSRKRGVLRLRQQNKKQFMTIKSHYKVIGGHKVAREYETEVSDIDTLEKGLKVLGFKKIGHIEAMREDWTIFGCMASIMRLPGTLWYVEIEGTGEKIEKIIKLLGYSKKDYYPRPVYKKYGIRSMFLKF